ncbi:hypothetical protein EEL52_06080 [Muribaculaceae bacterium Isolate-113 (HZI)]|jgi:hypothetical protein|uniref:hypothetical protein n=1 Tax=Bacteroidales TaxID=171549 RepID=UPI000F4A9DB4|nr:MULTISPECIES: hypothetical protein [Bacteroidales]MBJ2193991.1 hypothetical protein [Muribaculaceae bacterium]MBJ2198611.1 hypothetical protein [Muribaculaceae bacterium]ROS80531.1 hypothetical protein EEK90_14670 [Muribaculaceae bacterium Isolate-036 (Harlan)]ROT23298.1 hypothetical protein EEL52_06080 [Muribaculaceae bacterium Isolate-113 (HZI)]
MKRVLQAKLQRQRYQGIVTVDAVVYETVIPSFVSFRSFTLTDEVEIDQSEPFSCNCNSVDFAISTVIFRVDTIRLREMRKGVAVVLTDNIHTLDKIILQ